ncbi:MAG TPA: hypothetical protein VK507_18150 [Iamia sp.]|nr:hypothetical protein [Iamia sp.]
MADDRTLADLASRLDRLEAENADLRTRTTALETENAGLRAAPGDAPSPGPTLGRRALLTKGLAAAGAATAGAVLIDGAPAAAADGDPLVLGSSANSAANTTRLSASTSVGFAVEGTSNYALSGTTTSTQGIGVNANGRRAHLMLAHLPGRVPPIQDTEIFHRRGEIVFDAFSNLWLCTAEGDPGTWRTMVGNGSAGAFYPLATPIRVYDSRPGTTPSQGPKTKLTGTRVVDLKANASGVQAFSTMAVVNVLLVNATAGAGNVTIWADGQAKPQANSLVWGGSAGRFTTLAMTGIANGKVQVNASLATDLVLDVVGHFF